MQNSKFFKSAKIAEGTIRITGPGRVYCYLLEGGNKALLIDNQSGIGNIAEYCRELTSLPVITAVTHGHLEHCAGSFAFDEVFIHPSDIDFMYKWSAVELREDYVRGQNKKHNETLEWGPQDLTEVKEIRCLPLNEDITFDLGGRVIEVVETPGHTRGSVCFLDRKNRLMFAGDCCNSNTVLFTGDKLNPATIEEYLLSLKKLKKLQAAFDTYYISHVENPVDKSCIDDCIECCEQIMAGTDDAEHKEFFDFDCYYAKKMGKSKEGYISRLDGRIGNIAYSKDNIFMKK